MLTRMLLLIPYFGQLIRVSWLLFWDGRVSPFLKILPLAAVVYILSPIDLLRDYRLILGQLDDIIVAGLLLTLFVVFSPRRIVSEHVHGRDASHDDDDDPIEGNYRYVDRD